MSQFAPMMSEMAGRSAISIEIEWPEDLLDHDRVRANLGGYVREMAQEAYNFWVTAAGQRLNTSRTPYQQALSYTLTETSFALNMSGPFLVMAVELGTPPYPLVASQGGGIPDGTIVPLNVNRIPGGNLKGKDVEFRVATNTWKQHPGFHGMRIHEDVAIEIEEVLIPKLIDKVMADLGL